MKWVVGILAVGAMGAAMGFGAGVGTVPATVPAGKPSIFVCGDSTSKYAGGETMGSEMQGWGTPLAEFFDGGKVTVKNVGHAGTSSLTYYQGDWPKVIEQVKAGDFVLIIFGINDGGLMTPNGTGEETKSITVRERVIPDAHTYGWYMGKMASDARGKGARAYFLTVTARNIWTNPKVKFTDATPVGALPADYDAKEDRIERGTGNGRYTEWTKEEGEKLHVPVFDLTNYCADLYEKMGREAVNKLYKDHNHTYAAGAAIVAKAVVAGLKGFKGSPFVGLMSEKGKGVEGAEGRFVFDNVEGAGTGK